MSDKLFNRCLIVLSLIGAVLIFTDNRGECATDAECETLQGSEP